MHQRLTAGKRRLVQLQQYLLRQNGEVGDRPDELNRPKGLVCLDAGHRAR